MKYTTIAVAILLSSQIAQAGYDNPSDGEFYKAAQSARVPIADVRKVYACWHSKLGTNHTETHQQMLTVARASIQKAYLEGHTGEGEAVAQALRWCQTLP